MAFFEQINYHRTEEYYVQRHISVNHTYGNALPGNGIFYTGINFLNQFLGASPMLSPSFTWVS